MHPLPTGSRPSYLLVRRAEFPGPRTRSILANVNSQSIRTNTYFFGTKYVGAERAQVSQTMWRPASAGHAESRDEAWLGFSREAGDSNRLCAGICEDPRKTLGSQKTAASEVHEPDGGEKTVGRLSEPGADQNQPPRRWTAAKRLEAASANPARTRTSRPGAGQQRRNCRPPQRTRRGPEPAAQALDSSEETGGRFSGLARRVTRPALQGWLTGQDYFPARFSGLPVVGFSRHGTSCLLRDLPAHHLAY